MAFTLGLSPAQMYDLSLWELNACVRAYNRRREAEAEAAIRDIWLTANLTGAAFAGKLKRLEHYTRRTAIAAPSVTAEQMAALDKRFEERRGANGGGKP